MSLNNTEEVKMHVIEGTQIDENENEPIQAVMNDIEEVDEKELQQLYEENKDAIDLMGGLDMFESLMALPDDDFEQLKPSFIQLFKETLNDNESKKEILAMIVAEDYTPARLELEYKTAIEALDTIDFLVNYRKESPYQLTPMTLMRAWIYIVLRNILLVLAKQLSYQRVLKWQYQTDMLFLSNQEVDNRRKQNFGWQTHLDLSTQVIVMKLE